MTLVIEQNGSPTLCACYAYVE